MNWLTRLGLVLLLLASSPGRSAPAPSDELKALRAKLQALKRDIARNEESRVEAADALKSSEQAISEANRRLAELAASRQDIDSRLSDLRGQREVLEQHLSRQQALAARLVYQHYTRGESGSLQVLASGENPNDVARTGVYLEYIAQARRDVLAGLHKDVESLRAVTEESARRQQELIEVEDQQLAERTRLDEERKNRQKVLARVSAQIERQRRQAGALARDEHRLSKLVEDLRKMLAAPKPPPRAPSPEQAPRSIQRDTVFEQLKGRLQMPVRGELVGRYGSPRSDSGLSWRGLFIQAPAGREVKAVAPGRIVFADWLRGFGNLLILDHGDGFMSLYGNNEALLGRIGDSVDGGQTVATVGSSGGNTASGLYFELRHQGKPFDPSSWLNIK